MADNILWILTDDQMRSTLPTMDRTCKRLAEKGVRFPGVRRDAVVWAVARVDREPPLRPRHGCSTNMTHPPFVAQGLDQDTVATRMSAAGYDTGYDGCVH